MLLLGQMPSTYSAPSTMNTMIAATLIPANQNSNSPNERTENRLVAVIRIISSSESSQSGTSIQYCRILAPATASNPTTMTQKYQYSQPTEKPAQPPKARRA
jgi:hypothetical protein